MAISRRRVFNTRMWDEWKYGYLSKLKLHFIHAGKADTRESAFRLGVAHVETARRVLLRNNGRPIMCIIPTSCGVSFRVCRLFLGSDVATADDNRTVFSRFPSGHSRPSFEEASRSLLRKAELNYCKFEITAIHGEIPAFR